MPTYGRPEFALQAAQYFLRQDYPERELLILDDTADDLSPDLPCDSRIRYLRLPRLSIGAKRNIGCSLATGEIIAQWDDDDWYGRGRLSAQVRPLLEGRAEITGIKGNLVFDLAGWQAWACTSRLHRMMYRHDVHGGTLVFFRWCWEELARYPDRSLSEDARFLSRLMRAGARLVRIEDARLFVYIRHGTNTWPFRCGRFLDPGGWRSSSGVPLPAEDRPFYVARAATAAAAAPPEPAWPGSTLLRQAVSRVLSAIDA
ncbi:MAG: glycosyltransferase family 2 protein [Rhodospirillales bacterium]|nr:glycosyltransferase family 2 protein [Rhodospirillales bacterium]